MTGLNMRVQIRVNKFSERVNQTACHAGSEQMRRP